MNDETLSKCITIVFIIMIIYVLHAILLPSNDDNILDQIKNKICANTNIQVPIIIQQNNITPKSQKIKQEENIPIKAEQIVSKPEQQNTFVMTNPQNVPVISNVNDTKPVVQPTHQIKGWTDQGCWKDDQHRTISLMMNGKVYQTPEQCIKEADNTNANVVGLQAGGYCFIGNDDNYRKLGKSTEPICGLLGSDWVNHVFTKN